MDLRAPASTDEFAALLRANCLPVDDLAEVEASDCLVAVDDGEVVGAVGLQVFGGDALLRSLAVSGARRGNGIGERLVEAIERHARDRDVASLYLLTDTAESWFARRGYERALRADAPATIRATREFSSLCPASAAFMCKPLPPYSTTETIP